MAALQRRTRKASLNNYMTEENNTFEIEEYIADLKDEIEQAKEEARPTTVKREIILLIMCHGVDLPDDRVNRNTVLRRRDEVTRTYSDVKISTRQCVAGIPGTLMSQSGLYKDKLLQSFYKDNIHRINLQARKKIIENTIRLHTAEDTEAHAKKFQKNKGPRRKKFYQHLKTLKLTNNIYHDRIFEKVMNFDVRTIKPHYNHAYDLVERLGNSATVDAKNEERFGVFTVLHSTEPEDQNNTVFGCCQTKSKGNIDISQITKDKVDLHESEYWKARLKCVGFMDLETNLSNQSKFRKHGFHRRVIFLSTLFNYLYHIYDNIYIIDISCRDLSRYVGRNPKGAINREAMALNEVSNGSYSPVQEAAQVAE